MLIFLKKDETSKKRYSDFRILLPSEYTEPGEFRQDKIFPLGHLIPPSKLISDYLDNSISRKIFRKKYFDYLQEDDVRCTLSYIIYDIVKNQRDYAITCSDEEYEFGYMDFLAEFIHKFFGLNILTHKAYKNLELDKDVIIQLNSIPEDVFDIILEDIRSSQEEKKKKNKKKKGKGKGKKKNKKKYSNEKENNYGFSKSRLENYGYGMRDPDKKDDDKKPPTREVFRRI